MNIFQILMTIFGFISLIFIIVFIFTNELIGFVPASLGLLLLFWVLSPNNKAKKQTKQSICDYHISVNLKGYTIITENGDTLKTIKFGEIPKIDTIIYNDNK